MIDLIIFYFHILGFTFGFTKEFQKEGLGAGFLTLGFMALIFSVGWSITSFFLRYMLSEAGFGVWLDRSTLSLVLLTMGETIFYYYYYRNPKAD